MVKRITSLYLASLIVSVGLIGLVLLNPRTAQERPVQVTINSSGDVHDVVAAVNSLHRNDVDIRTFSRKSQPSFAGLEAAPVMALGLMVMTGVILALYKLICGWLKTTPEI